MENLIWLKDPTRVVIIESPFMPKENSSWAKKRFDKIKYKIISRIIYWNNIIGNILATIAAIIVASIFVFGGAYIGYITHSHAMFIIGYPAGLLTFLTFIVIKDKFDLRGCEINWRKYTKSGKRSKNKRK